MNEYVDDLYLKLSKEEFIEEYVKVKNKQHTLNDYDLRLENSAIIRAFEANIAFMTILERGYRYDEDKNMIDKSEWKNTRVKRGRRAVGRVIRIILNKGIHLLLHYNKETEKNKMKLYEIDELIAKCVVINDNEAVDTSTGEIIDIDYLEHLQMERSKKTEYLIKV